MIAYFDTSALVALLVVEPGSAVAIQSWLAAELIVSSAITYAEARAALAAIGRSGRVSARQLAANVSRLEGLDAAIETVEIVRPLIRRAGQLAQDHGLRGFDAVHLACGEAVNSQDLVFVAGDRRLLAAAHRTGLATLSLDSGR